MEARREGGADLLSRLPGLAYQCRNDPARTLDVASRGAKLLTGYDPSELVGPEGLRFADLIHPEDREAAWNQIQRSISPDDPSFEVGYRIVRRDGEVRSVWERGHAVYSEEGEILGLEGFVTDVSELEHVRRSLGETERMVRSLVEQGLVGVYVIQDGVFTYVNQAFADIFGYDVQEIEGRIGPLDLASEEDRETVQTRIRRRLRGEEESARYELIGRRKDGSRIRVEVHGTRIEQQGEAAIAGVLIDVTAQSALQDQLRHAQRVEGLGELTGTIAHDFNNYLTAIIAPIEMALQDLEEGDPTRDELLVARATAERAAGLTRQLLSFGRKRVHSPRPVSVNEVLKNLANMLERVTGARIRLVYDLAPDLPAVIADPSHLQQVIVNLVVNARDAMPDGGRVVLRTGVRTGGRSEVRRRDDVESDSYVTITVHDEGHGMERETLKHIFDPYFTTKETGTGLGLSTVFGIVRQHGGEVEATSTPGRGTDVTVFLPATNRTAEAVEERTGRREEGREGEEGEDLPASPDRGKTILVVEDEEAVRRVTAAALRRFGYTVLDAADGTQALQLIDSHMGSLDLLVTDMGLPKMTGADLASALEERRPHVPVLFMSGHASEDLVGELDDRSEVQFLEKPFMVDELLDAVKRALEGPERPSSRDVG
ncbi:MAG: PAS domain S-box protein [Longimicrobiales bacterium]|nr:PAS domain S-box protein [Longimicrobiales bacterium]